MVATTAHRLAAGTLPAAGRTAARGRARQAAAKPAWQVRLFLGALAVPWIIPVGPLNLSVYRIVLLASLFPCIIAWLRGGAGRIRAADIALLLFALWSDLALIHAHGLGGAAQPAGILFVETMGAYLLARCYIRDAEAFRGMVAFMARLVILLLPFALFEWLTGYKPLLVAFGTVFPTVDSTLMSPRMGFWRVQGPFEHSILFGTVCGSLFSLTALVLGRSMSWLPRLLLAGTVGFTAALSMSSAPIAGLALQGALMTWNAALKSFPGRWKVLWGLVLVAYLVVEFGSNQTPIAFYISKFTFDGETGWYRMFIWQYGSASVLAHPLFGIGQADWARPAWMASNSVDNFWLLIAMRYGLPAVTLLAAAFLFVMFSVSGRKLQDDTVEAYRIGYLLCLASFAIVGCTVHFWTAPYVWLMFLLGSGAWLLEQEAPKPAKGIRPSGQRRAGATSPAYGPPSRRRTPRRRAPYDAGEK